jgi:hypothetical protein
MIAFGLSLRCHLLSTTIIVLPIFPGNSSPALVTVDGSSSEPCSKFKSGTHGPPTGSDSRLLPGDAAGATARTLVSLPAASAVTPAIIMMILGLSLRPSIAAAVVAGVCCRCRGGRRDRCLAQVATS